MIHLLYIFNMIRVIFLFPLLINQGKKIRQKIPGLQEPEDTEGTIENQSNEEYKILVLGESTIAGIGVSSHREGISGQLAFFLAQHLKKNIRWHVEAKSGYTVEKVNTMLIPKIKIDEPDMIVIGLGGNDSFKLTPPGKWSRHHHMLIQNLRARYGKLVPIIYCNMPPVKRFPAFTPQVRETIGRQTEILGRALEKVVNMHANTYFVNNNINIADWMKKTDGNTTIEDFFSDGVHPSGLTYKLWSEEVYNFILKNNIIKNR